MSNVVPFDNAKAGEIMEAVLLRGDLSQLTQAERTRYMTRVCESLGLNPLTKPFEYLMLNGKLTLYALKSATDQLRRIHGVSVTNLTESERDGVYIVTAFVQDRHGRTDAGKGAVNIAKLSGDALANALIAIERAAAVTKACEDAIGKTERALEAPRLVNALGAYVDRRTVVINLRAAKAGLDAAIAVAESCQWPTSGDYLEM